MKIIETNFQVYVYIKGKEEWKPVNYPGINGTKYMISNHGNVKNIKTGRMIKPYPDGKNRYLYISFATEENKKKRRNISIHRLVAWHFVDGFTSERNEVNHIDNNERNNYYENLEWCTHAENNQHTIKQNRNFKQKEAFIKMVKENNPNKRYSDEIVHDICVYLDKGIPYRSVAKIITDKYSNHVFNIKNLEGYVSQILCGSARQNISSKYNFIKPYHMVL